MTPGLRFSLRDFVRLNPAPGSHRVALRAGLSVAVPLLTVVLIDRTSWALYAAFGAFASIYGRNHVHLSRAVMQATVSLSLVTAVVLGSVFAAVHASPWALVLGGAAVAAVGSIVSTVLDWHPPGPVFVLFAFGAVASSPGGWSDVPVALVVTAASAAFAVAVGNIGSVARWTAATRPQLRSPWSREPLRFLVAVGLSGAIATAAGIGHPYWAMVAAAAPLTARGLDHQALRAGHRIAGTVLGLATCAPLLVLELGPVALVLVVVALQVATEFFVGRNYGLALLFITPMAILMGQLGTSRPVGPLLGDRVVETVIGALVEVALLLVEHRRARRNT